MINRLEKAKGFTMIELIMAMLVSSILVLTAGIMLYYGWQGWSRNSIKMALQADAIYAMDILDRTIRPLKNADLSIDGTGAELWKSGSRFLYLSGGNIRRVSGANDDIIIKNAASLSFTAGNPIAINATLQDQGGTDSVTLNFAVGGRG
jgi:prepilin-type N-terminal cleavage/methylation domain-containing protein